MSTANVEQAITDLDAAFNRRDLEAVLDCYEDDAVLMVEPGRSIAGPGTVYTGGTQVTHGGHLWNAKWWTQGEAPSTGGSGRPDSRWATPRRWRG